VSHRPRLVILYEDSRGPTTRFPLHDLVVKSAADLLQSGVDIHELFRRVVAVPRNGVNKVVDTVRRGDRFWQHGTHVLVWVDNDRIRRALRLEPRCSKATVFSAIKACAPVDPRGAPAAQLEVFLLENNLEDLLSSIDGQLDATLLGKALAKRLDARDILLDEIARSRQLRAALRASHAGFDWVSRFVASIVETDSPPP